MARAASPHTPSSRPIDLFCRPHEELTEIRFLCELLDALPTERLAYLHVAGALERDGLYHDTHAHPVGSGVLDLLETVCGALRPGGVLLERDQDYGSDAELAAELAAVRRIHDRAARMPA